MQLVNKNAPAPAVLKALISAAFIFLSVFHLAPTALNAQAINQLTTTAASFDIAGLPLPGEPTVYTAAPGLNVYFLSVGQGDAIYIELPNGQNALIDGGPSKSATGPLAKFLSDKNISSIDHVVLTHPHSDHYKGLQYVFSSIKVGNFYDTRLDNSGSTGDETVRAMAQKQGTNALYPAPGDSLSWGPGGIGVKVFNSCPQPMRSSDGDVINGCSITMKLTYQNVSMLFVGDAEEAVEARLVAAFGAELKSDVLKVGHHGSAYSSTMPFLEAVRPSRAYIEVGANSYGHPTQSALSRILAVGAKIFRSDLDGTQELFVDGPLEAGETGD